MNRSESVKNLAAALAKAQAEMSVVKFNAQNPFLKNKYADLGAVIETSRPTLAKHELSISQFPISQDDKIGVTTILLHSSGEWLEETIFIPIGEQKGLSVAQSAGVVISYLRRYSWVAVLGLYADEDTDGHSENGSKPDVALEKKPAPEKKTPVPATNIQQLRVTFSKMFAEAKSRGVEVPALNGKATVEEIEVAINNIQAKMDAIPY